MKTLLTLVALLLGLSAQAQWGPNTKIYGNNTFTNAIIVTGATNFGNNSLRVWSITGQSTNAATAYVMLWETNNLPPAGATGAKFAFAVNPGQYYSFDLGAHGVDMDALTLTASTVANSNVVTGNNLTFQAIITPRQ